MSEFNPTTPASEPESIETSVSRRALFQTGAVLLGGLALTRMARAQDLPPAEPVPVPPAPAAAAPATAEPAPAVPAPAAPAFETPTTVAAPGMVAPATPSGIAPVVPARAAAPAGTPSREGRVPHHRRMAMSDVAILNFALGLEHLEHAFYSQAIDASAEFPFLRGRLAILVPAIRDNEAAHVAAITKLITENGGVPVAPRTYTFPAVALISSVSFAEFAHVLEDIGIGAYLGALASIRDGGLRRAASSIYGVEARHAALLRQYGGFEWSPRYFEGALTVEQVHGLIKPYVS